MVRVIKLGNGDKLRVSGSMDALNDLAVVLGYAGMYLDERGYEYIQKPIWETHGQIYDALDERGYYDDVKGEEVTA